MTTTSLTAADLMSAFFTHFGAGDREEVTALFADQVNFKVAGAPHVPWTGQRTERRQVGAFLDATETVEPVEFRVDRVLADGDVAVALGRFSHRVIATGRQFTSDFALHVEASEGRIVGYRMFEDSYAVAEAFAQPPG